jgi:hypothetical protein
MTMHAVVWQVDVKKDWTGNPDEGLDMLVGMLKTVPGFRRATWTTDGERGLSFQLFETEEAARAVAGNSVMPPDSPVEFRSVDVYEVIRDVS